MMAGWTIGTEAWALIGAWALVMILVVWLLVREPTQDPRDDPRAILRARFARGEITEEEFRRATAVLDADVLVNPSSGNHPHAAPHARGHEARQD